MIEVADVQSMPEYTVVGLPLVRRWAWWRFIFFLEVCQLLGLRNGYMVLGSEDRRTSECNCMV